MEHTVEKSFIIEGHATACEGWKTKLENKFPTIFKRSIPETVKVVQIHEQLKDSRPFVAGTKEHTDYSFHRGQKVRVHDGSYNEDVTGKNRSGIDYLFRNNTATIIGFTHYHWFNTVCDGRVTLNLILQFPNEIVFCAPSCVTVVDEVVIPETDRVLVDAAFVKEAYRAAGSDWRAKIREKFPDLFHPEVEVVEIHMKEGKVTERRDFTFYAGQKVKITDNSYVEHFDGISTTEYYEHNGTIQCFVHDKWHEWGLWKTTLNLLVKMNDGKLLYIAPCCVRKL
jgi:hypothetical protein